MKLSWVTTLMTLWGWETYASRSGSYEMTDGEVKEEEIGPKQVKKLNTAKTLKQLYKQNRGRIKLMHKIGKSTMGHVAEYQRNKGPKRSKARSTRSRSGKSVEVAEHEPDLGNESHSWSSRQVTETHTETRTEAGGTPADEDAADFAPKIKRHDYHVNVELTAH